MIPKRWPRPASRRFVNYFAATLRTSSIAARCIPNCRGCRGSDYGQHAMLLTTTGQMLFTMALFGVVAGALLLIAIAVDDAL